MGKIWAGRNTPFHKVRSLATKHMNPKREETIFNLGCFIVLIGLISFAVTATIINSKFWIAFVILFLMWFMICNIRYKKRRVRDSEIFNRIFDPMGNAKPTIQYGAQYGFTHFILTFSSKVDMKKAKEDGHIEAFKNAIQEAYKHTGSKRNPFDIEKAVYVTSE